MYQKGESVMKEFGVNDVFGLICRNGGKMGYKAMAAEFEVDGTSMKLRNCLVKLRRRGLIEYVAAESAWVLTEDGVKKGGYDG